MSLRICTYVEKCVKLIKRNYVIEDTYSNVCLPGNKKVDCYGFTIFEFGYGVVSRKQ